MTREFNKTSSDVRPAADIAQDLTSEIASAADDIDRLRRLPDDLVSSLKAAGAFRQLIPREYGGLGVELPDFINALSIFAQADASVAWCISQGAVIATTSLWLPAESARALWLDPAAAIANGPPRGCEAKQTSDGLSVTGNWGFSSGCQHATWMHGAVRRAEDGVWTGVYFPKEQAQFHDNWQVAGLRGTGSFEFSVDGLGVSDEWVTDFRVAPIAGGVLYKIPTGLIFAVSFAAVAVGVARASLDATIDLAQGKVPGYAKQTVRDDPDMQKFLGEAEMRWHAARAYLHDTVTSVYSEIGSKITDAQRIALRMTGTHVIRESAAVVNLAYTVAGSTAIYQDNPLQRRYQDMQVITQHVQARMSHYGLVGRYFLGHPFQPGPLN